MEAKSVRMDHLDSASTTLSPLPSVLTHGLVAVTAFGFLSFFFSTSLFTYLTYHLLRWRFRSTSYMPINQFLLLIYNLLLADIQQSLAFSLNITALSRDAIDVNTSTCWAQGWFVSTGDLASSVFILAIAIHTFMAIVMDYKPPGWALYSAIGFCWVFVYGTAVIGVRMHPEDIYVRAGAWCWINDTYQTERLWLHYFWIFLAIFMTIAIYASIYIILHRRRLSYATSLPSTSSSQRPLTPSAPAPPAPHPTPVMLLYPLIYTICTTPLAAGRIASMAGRDVDLAFFCFAGSMIACNGWLDVLLYGSTRRGIVFSEEPPAYDAVGLDTFVLGKGQMGNFVVVEALGSGGEDRGRESRASGRLRDGKMGKLLGYAVGIVKGKDSRRPRLGRGASEEELYERGKEGREGGRCASAGGITAETTVHVSVEREGSDGGYEMEERGSRSPGHSKLKKEPSFEA